MVLRLHVVHAVCRAADAHVDNPVIVRDGRHRVVEGGARQGRERDHRRELFAGSGGKAKGTEAAAGAGSEVSATLSLLSGSS